MRTNSLIHKMKNLLGLVALMLVGSCMAVKYTPDWSSLDTRPLPEWYDDAKVGIFIHWGVFSVPSFRSEWFWQHWIGDKSPECVEFMKKNYPPGFTYADFAKEFRAEFFEPTEWASLFESAGAKYVVLTAKHHEGYCNWPSANSWNWNSQDVGPNRDLVGDLASAIRANTNIRFGVYHSMYEWFNPLYIRDRESRFQSQDFVKYKTLPELYDLVNRYQPEVVWSDGDWDVSDSYWNSTQFLAWLYNESPVKDTIVVNDRWGNNCMCRHGDVYTCTDNYNPGKLQGHKWENACPLDTNSWGYRRNMNLSDVLSIDQVLEQLVQTVSCGGNLLLNIGPTKEGTVPPIFEERLRQMGQWLSVNGEAIYSTRPWQYQNDTVNPDVWYTRSKKTSTVYAILLKYPSNGIVHMTAPIASDSTRISLIGFAGKLNWNSNKNIRINLGQVDLNAAGLKWALVFKLDGLKNSL